MSSGKSFFLLSFVGVVTAFLVLEFDGVGGETSGVVISEELERQLKILNKPARQSFQDVDGSIYDCVDIDKQPALDHPLLKNHKIQTEPPFLPKKVNGNQANFPFPEPIKIGIKGMECPPGTVIIRRTLKEDLIWASKHSQPHRTNAVMNSKHYHKAQIGTATRSYHAAKGILNVFNPTVKEDQFSEARIQVQHLSDQIVNHIDVGWTVNQALFRDNQSRLFSFWTADEDRRTGCFNTLCPGFVQTSRNVTFGMPLRSSDYGSPYQTAIILELLLNPKTGDWYVQLSPGEYEIGYWPRELFTGLADHATQVFWGGQVYSSTADSPPMGSGHFASEKFSRACFIFNLTVMVEGSNEYEDARKVKLMTSTSSHCYTSEYGGWNFQVGDMMYFGGPGGGDC